MDAVTHSGRRELGIFPDRDSRWEMFVHSCNASVSSSGSLEALFLFSLAPPMAVYAV